MWSNRGDSRINAKHIIKNLDTRTLYWYVCILEQLMRQSSQSAATPWSSSPSPPSHGALVWCISPHWGVLLTILLNCAPSVILEVRYWQVFLLLDDWFQQKLLYGDTDRRYKLSRNREKEESTIILLQLYIWRVADTYALLIYGANFTRSNNTTTATANNDANITKANAVLTSWTYGRAISIVQISLIITSCMLLRLLLL